MINHLRTLLINLSGPSTYAYPGEEYIPPGFAQLGLPAEVAAIHEVLYGKHADLVKKNYRVRQLLTAVHNSDLEDLALKLDSRVTYLPLEESKLVLPSIIEVAGDASGLQLVDACVRELPTGELYFAWEVRVTGYTPDSSGQTIAVSLDIMQVSPANVVPINKVYAVTRGLSEKVPLPGSSLGLLVSAGNPIGTEWKISTIAEPRLDFGEVLQQIRGLTATTALFNSLYNAEDLLAEDRERIQVAWQDTARPLRQAAALALAIGYRMHTVLSV